MTFLTTFAKKLNDCTMLNTIDEGIKAVRQGKIVIVVDDEIEKMKGILSYPAKKSPLILSIS